ncbi:unnamed protein product [Angiostrongylus costaricensis]|uniref:Inhibitor_I29 domain-containing protein n=1 Tax=Angiostrongylus costaricensis TaxID=334426 RepID=A0A158PKJ8_ANGCS|nr:unnamed protein product [Angiostrongylus costaricensis]
MRLIFATFMVLLLVEKHEAQTYENHGNHGANNGSTLSADEERLIGLYARAYQEFLELLDGKRNLGEAREIATLIAEINNGTDSGSWDISNLGAFEALFATPKVIVDSSSSSNNDSTSTEPNTELDLAD